MTSEYKYKKAIHIPMAEKYNVDPFSYSIYIYSHKSKFTNAKLVSVGYITTSHCRKKTVKVVYFIFGSQ